VTEFDPYLSWLDIPVHERPPSYYRLLGLPPGESDTTKIQAAADRATDHVRQFASGNEAARCEKLLVEIRTARDCLLDPKQSAAYDAELASQVNRFEGPIKPPPPVPSASKRTNDGHTQVAADTTGERVEEPLFGRETPVVPSSSSDVDRSAKQPTIRPAPPPPTTTDLAHVRSAAPQVPVAPPSSVDTSLSGTTDGVAGSGESGAVVSSDAVGAQPALPLPNRAAASSVPPSSPPPVAPPVTPPPVSDIEPPTEDRSALDAAEATPNKPGEWIPVGRRGRVGTTMAEAIDGVQQPKPLRVNATRRVRRRTRIDFSRVANTLIMLAAIALGVALLMAVAYALR
jgi:hypothetical protein